MNVHNYSVFPSIITEVECDCFNHIRDPLIEWIENYATTNAGVTLSNRGGWQSKSDFYELDSFEQYVDYILTYTTSALSFYNLDFKLSNMWININKRGDYNMSHCHPSSIISGVLWVKCPENCGSLVFNSPNIFSESQLILSIDEDVKNKINYHESFVFSNPSEGKIILFPSHLHHHVEPNESEYDRISIAFNLVAENKGS